MQVQCEMQSRHRSIRIFSVPANIHTYQVPVKGLVPVTMYIYVPRDTYFACTLNTSRTLNTLDTECSTSVK